MCTNMYIQFKIRHFAIVAAAVIRLGSNQFRFLAKTFLSHIIGCDATRIVSGCGVKRLAEVNRKFNGKRR